VDGRLKKIGERHELGFERYLKHPPEKVWRVLTERNLLRQWFPCDVVGDWEVGAPLSFNFLHGEGEGLPEDQLRGEVLVVETNRRLEFRWGDSVIRCTLIPDDGGCRLLFSEALPNASWGARNAAGWELCLENLDVLINGLELAIFAMDVWRQRFEHYREEFEPDFGPQQDPFESHTEEI
jgi:uncharacterized protein YndB with AHSA1/START domain